MELYCEELKKILNKKITWILIGVLFIFFAGQIIFEAGNVQTVINDFNLAAGYKRFLDLVELLLVVGIIVEIIVVSPIFCEDKELRTEDLIYSTPKGRFNDYFARIFVVLSMMLSINLLLIVVTGIANVIFYGIPNKIVTMEQMYIFDLPVANERIIVFVIYYVFNILIESVFTTAIIAFFSSFCKKVINAEIIVFAIIFAPVFFETVLKNSSTNLAYYFMIIQPIMSIPSRIVQQTWDFNIIKTIVVVFISLVLFIYGGIKWTKLP